MHVFKSTRPQGAATFDEPGKDYTFSENAVEGECNAFDPAPDRDHPYLPAGNFIWRRALRR
jgi:hypothetical protein